MRLPLARTPSLHHPRPRAFVVPAEDPDKALDDPAMAALAADGWTVAAALHVVTNTPNGDRPSVLLVLWPPPSRSWVSDWPGAVVVLGLAALVVALAFGFAVVVTALAWWG